MTAAPESSRSTGAPATSKTDTGRRTPPGCGACPWERLTRADRCGRVFGTIAVSQPRALVAPPVRWPASRGRGEWAGWPLAERVSDEQRHDPRGLR